MPSANPDPTEAVPFRTGLHLADIQIHDPWILADQATHTYYLYTSASAAATGQHRGHFSDELIGMDRLLQQFEMKALFLGAMQ